MIKRQGGSIVLLGQGGRVGILLAVACGALVLGGARSVRAVEPVIAADHSLSVEEYSKAGVPRCELAWTAESYRQAAAALAKIGGEDPLHLPRYGSESSGKVFARMVASDNLAAVDPNGKENPNLEMMPAVGQLLTVYVKASQQAGAAFDNEMVDLSVLMGRLSKDTLGATIRSIGVPAEGDPKYAVKVKTLAQMKGGAANVMQGALTTLADSRNLRLEARIRYAKALCDILPDIVEYVAPEVTTRSVHLLEGRVKTQGDADFKAALQTLLDKIKAAQDKAR